MASPAGVRGSVSTKSRTATAKRLVRAFSSSAVRSTSWTRCRYRAHAIGGLFRYFWPFNRSLSAILQSLNPAIFAISASVQRDAAEQIEIREHLARAEDDRRERILRELHRQAGLFAQPLVEILEQRAAAG